jgi:hypothetical protein
MLFEYKGIERFMTKGNWTTFFHEEGPAKFDVCLFLHESVFVLFYDYGSANGRG